jgi:hypothetical protein
MFEVPKHQKRAEALMKVIERMISRHKSHNGWNLDEGMFILFEKAKRIHYAEDRKSLADSIMNI